MLPWKLPRHNADIFTPEADSLMLYPICISAQTHISWTARTVSFFRVLVADRTHCEEEIGNRYAGDTSVNSQALHINRNPNHRLRPQSAKLHRLTVSKSHHPESNRNLPNFVRMLFRWAMTTYLPTVVASHLSSLMAMGKYKEGKYACRIK